jgi:CO dehydrogenase/acetyl-CoA synthase alpha subunit
VSDPVNSPSHYKGNGMEAIDVIEAFGLDKSFCLGNVVKYVLRSGKKDATIQDLKKARWYLDRQITRMESAAKQVNNQSTPNESQP